MASIQVTLVVDGAFGTKAIEKVGSGPLWVVLSPENQRAIEQLRATNSFPPDHLTLFIGSGSTPEANVLSEISTIDMHHPGWTTLEIVGARNTAPIRDALDGYGNGTTTETATGLVFSRNPPER